jgi:hypothetical protein
VIWVAASISRRAIDIGSRTEHVTFSQNETTMFGCSLLTCYPRAACLESSQKWRRGVYQLHK